MFAAKIINKGKIVELFSTPISAPVLIALTIIYAIAAAITTYDIRVTQAEWDHNLPPNFSKPPIWIGNLFAWLLWICWASIFILNWKYALFLFVLKFVLKFLPILETIGELLLLPFRQKKVIHNQSTGQDRFDQLVSTLNQIRQGNAEKKHKKQISITLINSSPLNDQDKHELLKETEKVYSTE